MATTRPFAYNTGSTIDGTTQIGNIAIGVSDQDYSLNPGGVKWWMGPDEDLGYIICHEVPTGDQSTQVEVDAYLGFWRSTDLTAQSLLDLLNVLPITNGLPPFTDVNVAKTWLNNNGYFTSYGNNLPTPTPSPTPLPTATPTPSPTPTCNPNYVVSNGGTTHVYDGEPGTLWNGYGSNYLQVGPSQSGGGTDAPLAGWYFVDECGTVRQLTNNVLWMSGGNPSPYPNGTGWLCEADGPFTLTSSTTSLTFYETVPTVSYPTATPTPLPTDTPTPTPTPTIAPLTQKILFLGDVSVANNANDLNNTLQTLGYSATIDTQELGTTYDGNNIASGNYSLIIMQTNGNQNGAAQLSDNLKTFMDNGGHFIGQTFLWSIAPSGFDYTYTPFISGGYQGYNGGNLTLVNNHPVLGGLTYNSIPSSLVNNISNTLQSNSTLVYKFSDNMPLLAVQEVGSSRRVGINFWDSLTSNKFTGKVMATSILWCLGLYDVPPTATPTPLPTDTPTPTPTPPTSTPTPTPVMSTLNIDITPGTTNIIFDGVTYTSDTTISVVKNQQYTILTDASSGLFQYWTGTNVDLPAPNSSFTVVTITGDTATLQAIFPAPTSTPTPLPATSTPTPTVTATATPTPTVASTSTPTPLPATSTPTPTPTVAPTDTPTPNPTDTPTPTPAGPTSTPTPTPNVSTYYTIDISQVDLDDATGSGANNNRIRVSYTDDNNTNIITYYTTAGTFTNDICVKAGTTVNVLYYKNNIPKTGLSSATNTFISCGSGAPTPTPTVAPTDTPTPTPTVAPTDTPTPAPTDTPTPTPTVAPTATPTPLPATSTPTPTPTSGGSGSGSWYFYSDEGVINAGPPVADGNAIFTINAGSTIETFSPNVIDGVSYLYFNTKDSSGTDYTSQFSQYTGGTGTITISQNGDTATYTSSTSGSFNISNIGGNTFFIIDTSKCTQTKESNNPYVFVGAISLSFDSLTPTPTPTPGGPTATPTPTPTGGGSGNSWYFYTTENSPVTMPPLSNGQALFYQQIGPPVSKYSPNGSDGTNYIMFYLSDSTGTSYATQFNNLKNNGGTISITQNGNTATYTSTQPGAFNVDNAGFFIFNTALQTVSSPSAFVYGDPISITFGSGGSSTPTPTPVPPTATPTPTPNPTDTPTPTSTPTPTPTSTATPTPTVMQHFLLFEDGSIMTDENNNSIEYQY